MPKNTTEELTAEQIQSALTILLQATASGVLSDAQSALSGAVGVTTRRPPRTALEPSQAVSDYIQSKVRSKAWTGNTLLTRPGTLRRFSNWLGDDFDDVGTIDFKTIEQYREFLWREGLADSTVRLNLTCVRAFFSDLIKRGELAENPAANVRVERVTHLTRRRPLPEKGLNELLRRFEAAGDEKHLLPRIMCLTGIRPGELTQVRADDLRAVDDIPVIDLASVARRGGRIKTAAGQRLIPLSPQAVEISRVFKAKWGDKPWANRAVSVRFGKFLKAQGLGDEFSLYSARYRFAARARERRIAEADVAAILGHAHNDLTFGLYGAEVSPQVLFDVVVALQIEK